MPRPWVEAAGYGFIGTATVGPQSTSPIPFPGATFPPGSRLMLEHVTCGLGGGVQAVYVDDDANPLNDGTAFATTGASTMCSVGAGITSQSIDAGTYDLSVVLEDDFLGDNVGTRAVGIYWYIPD